MSRFQQTFFVLAAVVIAALAWEVRPIFSGVGSWEQMSFPVYHLLLLGTFLCLASQTGMGVTMATITLVLQLGAKGAVWVSPEGVPAQLDGIWVDALSFLFLLIGLCFAVVESRPERRRRKEAEELAVLIECNGRNLASLREDAEAVDGKVALIRRNVEAADTLAGVALEKSTRGVVDAASGVSAGTSSPLAQNRRAPSNVNPSPPIVQTPEDQRDPKD